MKTRNKLKIMGLVLALLLVLGVMPLISITADAAYTVQTTPFNTTITVNCKCGKDATVALAERVSYSVNGATWTYDIKVEWWCSTCYKNYSYTCSGISVTCDDCEKGTSVTVTENLSSGATINFKFWRDAGEHNSNDITTTPATCISTGEKRVDNCYYCGLTKTLETYPIDPKNHSFVNGICELCGAELHVCSSYDNGFCTEYGCYEPAELKDGYYQIKNAGQLYWFAGLVNGTLTDVEQNASANAVLMDDITVNSNVLDSNGNLVSDTSALKEWTQIGDSLNNGGFYYQGTFDGQGYTVSGLYHNSASKNVALVGSNSGTVCNVTVANSYFKGSVRTGGIVGWNEGSIYNCASIGCVLDTTDGFAGGIASVNTGKIYDCYNTSAVSGTLRVGGICGTIHGGGTVTNCYNIGVVTSDRLFGGIVGTFSNGEVGKVENCYFNSDVFTGDGVGIIGEGTVTNVEGKTTEQFASGEVAYLLGDAFGQNIDNGETVQTLPVFFGTTVYAIQNCKNETQYSNINQNVGHKWVNGICTVCNTPCGHTDSNHDGSAKYENGICTNCDGYEPAILVTNENHASLGLEAEYVDYYAISNAGQLFWFAEQVNNGETAINAILMNDIVINSQVLDADGNLISDTSALRQWTPIGQYNSDTDNLGFAAIFDGNGKTIRGLYHYGETARYAGLFGYSSGMVQDLTIADSYFHTTHSEGRAGSLVGRNHGTVSNCRNFGSVNGYMQIGGIAGWDSGTVEKCSNYGTVKGYYIVGGIAGVASNGTINDCYNLGSVEADNGVGGVVGWTQKTSNVNNCISIGTVEGSKDAGGVVGLVIDNFETNVTITNCYHDNTVCSYDPVGRNLFIATATSVEGKTTEQFASGEVAYLLGEHFGQTLEGENRQSYPVLGGAKIYYGYISCANGAVKVYTNDSTASDTKPKHTGGKATCTTPAVCENCGASYGKVDNTNHDSSVKYENGFCENGCYQPAELNESGYYEIANAGQLFWFANHVNTVDRTASAVLTADIDLENRLWTPIGSTGENSNNFRGVFDGQNHTIKGLYVVGGRAGLGFFGEVRTGTVKNFTIYGEVIVNTDVNYVGGVIGSVCGLNSSDHGLERNGAIIQNITSYVNLTAKTHGVGMIGGFVGYANHQSLIENCSWYGTFDAGIYRVDSGAGGFIGKIQEYSSEVTIRNCAAYGTIKTNYAGDYNNTATIYMGGFLSFSNTNAQTTLENCLFAGKFERGENLTDQAFLGAFGTLRSVKAIKNCYYLGDGVLEAVHSDSNLKPGSDNVEITSVTGAQLKSGEVAYKLGSAWGQTIDNKSYPVLGGEAVYQVLNCKNENAYSNTNVNIDHVYENGACTVCGESKPIDLGDVNGDGAITNADVLMIYRYIYNAELYPLDVTVGDVNGDGLITNADVLMIYRYIYNPELYPLG